MDPNVQVAFVSFLGVIVATCGVVIAALINNRKQQIKEAKAGLAPGDGDADVLNRVLFLVQESDRKEAMIKHLRKEKRQLAKSLRDCENNVRALKIENAHLILKVRDNPQT